MTGLTPRAARKTAKTVRRVAREKRNLVGKRIQTYPSGGKGKCECKEIHRFWTSGPTSGTFKVVYTIDGSAEQISWAYNASAADVQTAFEAHTKIDSGDVEVAGGPWPLVAVYITFKGNLESEAIAFPAPDNSSLTGGKGFMDKYAAVDL